LKHSTATRARGLTGIGLLLGLGACGTGPAPIAAPAPPAPPPLELLDVDSSFDCTDPGAFGVVTVGDDRVLQLFAAADYAPPHRSPLAIALVDGAEFRSFVLDAEMQQTGREYGHRDLCVIFGFESTERFYYTHLATTPDQNAHNVFLVDRAPRRNLLPPQAAGVDWGQAEWHHIRVVRDVDEGRVQVYFDDMDTPVLDAVDATIEWGRIGFGSFDDTGMFRRLHLTDQESRPLDRSGSPFAPSTAAPDGT